MATLADELLNDFNDSGEENDEVPTDGYTFGDFDADENGHDDDEKQDGTNDMALDQGNGEVNEDDAPGLRVKDDGETEDEVKARIEKMELRGVSDVRSVAGLMKQLEPLLEKIEFYKAKGDSEQDANMGRLEENPEYKLLTQSNTMSTNIDGEVTLVHKFVRDHYSARFPELETFIPNPLSYAKAVNVIGNDITKPTGVSKAAQDALRSVISSAEVMIINLEAGQTKGEELSASELATVKRACEMIFKLEKAKVDLSEYVQSRMALFAPNLTALIGSRTAAQLINYTGGISGLAKTPDRNLPSLGNRSNRKAVGLASNVGIRNQGFLFHTSIIEDVPEDLKVQAMRILSAKIILASRVDAAHQSPTGVMGLEYLDQVNKRIDKLSEVPANKGQRALPAPDDKPSRKRGGRRARKAKEAVAMTDIRKAQNRMAFGKEEAEVGYGTGDSTAGLGMIGMQDDGRVRALQIDQRTRAKLSKKNPGWGDATNVSGTATGIGGFGQGTATSLRAAGIRTSGVGGGISGLKTQAGNMGGMASTVAFTPVQGLELIDPKMREEQNRKRKAEADRWFSSGTFTNVGGAGPNTGSAKVDNAGFKVPALPIKKPKTESG